MPSRWDYLLDTKPVPVIEHLLGEIARLITQELGTWPPPVEALDLQLGKQFAPLFMPGRPRPSASVYAESFRLARWELERDTAAYDDYMRNQRWVQKALLPEDKQAMLFLSRWLVEQLLAIGEGTEGRINRPRMIDCLGRIERLLQPSLLLTSH